MNLFSSMSCSALLLLLFVCATPTHGQKIARPPAATPAPAPAPAHVNLTHLLTVAGPFSTFLGYLESTKVIDTFQNQANNTEEGITIFVPKDQGFASLKNPSLSNLTNDQLRQFCLFHALPHYYSLSDFKNLSQMSPVSTFAGGNGFALNFTDTSGAVRIDSGWTKTKVSSSVLATDPVALYEVDKPLLPEAIFGTDIPPTPAPAPAPTPVPSPAADSPADAADKAKSPTTSSPAGSSSHRIINYGVMSHLALAVFSVMTVLLL